MIEKSFDSFILSILLICVYNTSVVVVLPLSHVQFDPMDCSMPGFPVLRCLPEFAQAHVHWVSDAIQPSHPLSFPSPALYLSQHQQEQYIFPFQVKFPTVKGPQEVAVNRAVENMSKVPDGVKYMQPRGMELLSAECLKSSRNLPSKFCFGQRSLWAHILFYAG